MLIYVQIHRNHFVHDHTKSRLPDPHRARLRNAILRLDTRSGTSRRSPSVHGIASNNCPLVDSPQEWSQTSRRRKSPEIRLRSFTRSVRTNLYAYFHFVFSVNPSQGLSLILELDFPMFAIRKLSSKIKELSYYYTSLGFINVGKLRSKVGVKLWFAKMKFRTLHWFNVTSVWADYEQGMIVDGNFYGAIQELCIDKSESVPEVLQA